MWWWTYGVPGLLFGAYLADNLVHRFRRLRLWREGVRMTSGVEEVKASHPLSFRAKVTAKVGPLEVRITDARGKGEVTVVVEGPEGIPGLKLRRQLLGRDHEIETGDDRFDEAFLVEGPLPPVRALLDTATRRQLLRAHDACNPLDVDGGQIRAEVSEKKLTGTLSLLLEIGQQLAEPPDVDSQIVKNARHDSEPGVRLANMLFLARVYPGAPATLAVLEEACHDESPEVRLRAALVLGEEGRKVLLRLTERLQDDASSAQAVTHLGNQLDVERAKTILSKSLRKDFTETARACLEALGRRQAAAVDVLARVLEKRQGDLAIAAAKALGETGVQAAEAPLLRALQSEKSELREAAAAALGKVGTAAAVPPLQEATERFWLDLGLRQAARQAIAGIQARLEGASPGQLSLAGTDGAGQLSLAQAEAGQLTLTQDELGLQAFPTEETEPPPRRGREKKAARPA